MGQPPRGIIVSNDSAAVLSELSRARTHMASDEALVTGQVLPVNGIKHNWILDA